MMRIVAGTAKGRRLAVPAGRVTRPTSARAREGLFSTLLALGGPLTGRRVLDLYAGSGAVGLEALSRGAALATLVEAAPRALAALRANERALGLPGASVVAARVDRTLAAGPSGPRYDMVFADPPYAEPIDTLLAQLVTYGWLGEQALVVLERASRDAAPPWPTGIDCVQARRYGEATLWYGRSS